MGKAYAGKIGNINKTKEVEEVLNFPDYVFEIDGKDITDAKVTYYYDDMESVEFVDGKRGKEFLSPLLSLEISGVDDNNKDAFVSFMLKLDLETLNNFNNRIEDITKYMLETEAFIKKPNEDKSGFLYNRKVMLKISLQINVRIQTCITTKTEITIPYH